MGTVVVADMAEDAVQEAAATVLVGVDLGAVVVADMVAEAASTRLTETRKAVIAVDAIGTATKMHTTTRANQYKPAHNLVDQLT